MSVVRVDLEVSDKGTAQVIQNVGGQLKGLSAEGVKAGAAIGVGFALAQKGLDAALDLLRSIPSALVSAVKGVVDLGGNLADLSAKTGISSQALQKLAYAGSLVGVSQDDITAAAVKMEKALANGDAVFGKLGLSVSKLRAMQPDQAFAAVAAQIAKIKDPAGQAAAAMEAFGKSGATLLPLIKSDLAGATEEAERLGIVLSDKTVNAADALGDEATKLEAAWEGVKNQFAAAIIQNPQILAGLHALVEAMGDLSQWLIRNRGALGAVVDILIGTGASAVSGFKQFAEWAGKAGQKLKYIVDLVPGLRSALKVTQDMGTYLGMKNVEGSGLSSSSSLGQPAGGGLSFNGGSADIEAAKQRAKLIADTIAKVRVDAIKAVNAQIENEYKRNIKVVEQILETGAEQEKQIAQHRAEIYRALVAQLELGQKNAHIWREMEARELDTGAAKWATYGQAIAMVGAALGGSFGSILTGIGGAFDGLAKHEQQAADNLREYGSTAMTTGQKIQAIAGAIQGLVAAYKSGEAAGSGFNAALSGAGHGAAAGAAFGPYGAAIGAVAGAIIGLIGHHKGLAAAERAAAIEAERLKAALQLQNETEGWEKVNEAAQRYGFTMKELGPVLARQELDKQLGQIYQDWELLKAAGVDHEAMIERIGPSVGKLVDQYVAAGVEIPSAMKPIIDDLYQHHKLLHENGEEYTEAEYKGITYAQTMTQMFQELITKVDDLVSALLGIPNVTRTVTVRTVRVGDPPGGDPPGGDPPGGDPPVRTRVFSGGGGGGGHVFNIDARGSTHPEATAAAVKRAVLSLARNDGGFRAEFGQRIKV